MNATFRKGRTYRFKRNGFFIHEGPLIYQGCEVDRSNPKRNKYIFKHETMDFQQVCRRSVIDKGLVDVRHEQKPKEV